MACLLHFTLIIINSNTVTTNKVTTDDKNTFKQGMMKYILQQRDQNTPKYTTDDMFQNYDTDHVVNISTENKESKFVKFVTKKSVLFRRNRPLNVRRSLLASFGTMIRPIKKVSSSRPVFRYG